jgi:hypothetical protein
MTRILGNVPPPSSLRGGEADAAIQSGAKPPLDCFATLAMTKGMVGEARL